MEPLISIIIPCYNSFSTVGETFDSVLNQLYQNWEAIIVNDGSPDDLEVIALNWVRKDNRFKYYKKENGGLGSARNYGIKKATGKFVLPLDSDNTVSRDFLFKAIPIFESNKNISVVYGDALYFGVKEGLWSVGLFDEFKLSKSNYIDACALLRKEMLDKIGHYDTHFPYQGIEDWELWIRCIKNNIKFYYLEEITFKYRVSNASMIHSFTNEMTKKNMIYLYRKHLLFFIKVYFKYRNQNKTWIRDIARIIKVAYL